MTNTDSIFTQIINREAEAEILYEDDQAIIILSRAPHKPGHSLVIPKKPAETFYDMMDGEYVALQALALKFARVLNDVYAPKRVALEIMGLGVPHTHVHLVPIEDEHDLDQEKAVFVEDLIALAPEANKIRAALAAKPDWNTPS